MFAKQPAPSPAREALAKAITRKAEADKARTALTLATERLDTQVMAASFAVDAAAKALEQATTDAPAFLVAAALGASGERPKSVAQARAELEAAKDAQAAAREARDTLQAQDGPTEQAASSAATALRDAARAVLAEAPAIEPLLDLVEQKYEELARLTGEIVWLESRSLATAYVAAESHTPTMLRVKRLRNKLINVPSYENRWNELTVAGAARWIEAAAALERDASAALPT